MFDSCVSCTGKHFGSTLVKFKFKITKKCFYLAPISIAALLFESHTKYR